MSAMFDVLVVGGGPVGACAAALLVRGSAGSLTPLRVCVLEPKKPQQPASGSRVGCSRRRSVASE